jgi:hypothetical protein
MFDDAELQLLRARVHCIAVLERMSSGWKLDMRQSTRRALKYRRREGEILIISDNAEGGGIHSAEPRATSLTLSIISTPS